VAEVALGRLIRDVLAVVIAVVSRPEVRRSVVALRPVGRAFRRDRQPVPQQLPPLGRCMVKLDVLVTRRDAGSLENDPHSPDHGGAGRPIAPGIRRHARPPGVLVAAPAAGGRAGQEHRPASHDREHRPALGTADRHGLLQPEGILRSTDAVKQEDDDALFLHGLPFRWLRAPGHPRQTLIAGRVPRAWPCSLADWVILARRSRSSPAPGSSPLAVRALRASLAVAAGSTRSSIVQSGMSSSAIRTFRRSRHTPVPGHRSSTAAGDAKPHLPAATVSPGRHADGPPKGR
jgi:hypothetical protein